MSRAGALAAGASSVAAVGVVLALLLAAPPATGTSMPATAMPATAVPATALPATAVPATAAGQVTATADVPAPPARLACPAGPSAPTTTGRGGVVAATDVALALPASSAGAAPTLAAEGVTSGPEATGHAVGRSHAAGSAVAVTVPGRAGGVVSAGQAQGRGQAPLVAGSVLATSTGGDLRGLTSPACLPAVPTSWLVGATAATGHTQRLVLANTGQAPVTADVTLWTASGPRQPAALQGLVVAAGQRRTVVLGGVVAGSTPLALRVHATGAGVAAWMSEQVAHGLVSGGFDTVVPAAAPSTTLVVPGVVAGAGTPILRLVAPGTSPVLAHVHAQGPTGPAGGTLTVPVPAGRVVDVALTGLDASASAVVVSGDAPLLAAVGMDTAPGPSAAGDVAWTAAEPPLGAATLVALPAATTRLQLATGEGTASVTVRAVTSGGALAAPTVVGLPAGRSVGLSVAALAGGAGAVGLVLEATGDARAALVVTGASPDLLSVRPLAPAATAHGAVGVVLDGPP